MAPKPSRTRTQVLEDELAFYGCYHSHPGNQVRGSVCFRFCSPGLVAEGVPFSPPHSHHPLAPTTPSVKFIHFLFVPPILATLCVWLAYARGVDSPALLPRLPCSVANPAFLLVAAYAGYYSSLEPFAGGTWALFQGLPMWLGATAARTAHPASAWRWAVGVHLAAWLVQVGVGHGLVERRRPALTVSLGQALSSAALFAWLEGLFACGYRPDLKARLDARVAVGQAAMDRRGGLRRRRG